MRQNKQTLIITLTAVLAVIAIALAGMWVTRNLGKTQKTISRETAKNTLGDIYEEIDPNEATPVSSPLDFGDALSLEQELPEIDTCPVQVEAKTENYVEIFSSPEKAGEGNDRWLIDMAEEFNQTGNGMDIQVRTVNSGQALDYITSGKAVPDGWTPSAAFWASMAENRGVTLETVTERMVGNTVGIVLKDSAKKTLTEKYGAIDWKTITEAVAAKEITFGCTNPDASTGGMNALITTLQRYDPDNPLSDAAKEGFTKFQKNLRLVSLTTMQMKKAAEKGTIDGFILEYQSFVNEPSLKNGWSFTPYGYRHDNPLYACPGITEEQKETLAKFSEFCASKEAQDKASGYGFNGNGSYIYEYPQPSGETLLEAQGIYRENKNAGKRLAYVFVIDSSLSMEGDKIMTLKKSLLNSMQYMSEKDYVGLVSFNDDVTIELPVSEFNMDQQCFFKGAVERLTPNGGTAAYDGIAVAAKMLDDFKAADGGEDLHTLMFLLSDGQTIHGHTLNEIRPILESMQLGIHTIGYGEDADKDTLETISGIGEASSIYASTDDVTYQIRSLLKNTL